MKYVLHFGPDALQIDMEGDFTFHDYRSFQKILGALKHNDSREEIRLNLSRLSSIDSTALRLLMLAHDLSKKTHRKLVFDGPSGSVLTSLTEAARYNILNIAV